MKHLLILATIFSLSTISIFADDGNKVIPVKLDNEHREIPVKFDMFNVVVTKDTVDDEGNARVRIEIKNLDEKHFIFLFGHAFSERDLKRQKIIFDKNFPGTKGQRIIDTYSGMQDDLLYVEPDRTCRLPDIQVSRGEIAQCRLPLYIARYKNNWSNKLLMTDEIINELKIEVAAEDSDYISLDSLYNALVEEIGKQSFCPHPSHKPSLKEQQAPYKTRIDSIQSEIEKIKQKHGWFDNDKEFEKFRNLRQKLADIDFSAREKDCGKDTSIHKPSNNNCKYCNLTPQEISHKLEDYYKKIFSSNNRNETKKAVISDVKLLYGCRKHSQKWKNSQYKAGIEKYYQGINKF